ncbi:disease resistance protein RPM1-like [Rhodamnia argentea]|uniref:Disease resistance protein RPM1-like n=1 Tax=Rhodamnia argentea TaxID=178133 RepID=A0ABM3HBR5_9MYRT|nr:disease resistance protein RPM1-like [Rhodamnia argentea]
MGRALTESHSLLHLSLLSVSRRERRPPWFGCFVSPPALAADRRLSPSSLSWPKRQTTPQSSPSPTISTLQICAIPALLPHRHACPRPVAAVDLALNACRSVSDTDTAAISFWPEFCSRAIKELPRHNQQSGHDHGVSSEVELQCLSPEESWSLFCKKAFRGKPCPPHLEHLSLQILRKCEGLPLAIVAIGGLLFAKDDQEWEMIARSLAAELETDDKMQIFGKILSLSYSDLPDNLKSCFLYLGVFPEDHVIQCRRLYRLWIAEGFVEEREGMTQDEVAERHLKQLIDRSLVQIAETREKELHERVRRLSVQSTNNNALNQLNLPRLRSLLVFEFGESSTTDEQLVPSGSKLLRVLDLGGSSLHNFPRQILVLFHLKYLSLRGTKVRIIPSSIGKLQSLDTLDLRQTLISELPVEITKLKKLQNLLVYRDSELTFPLPFGPRKGISAPEGMGALKSLQKLCYVKAGGGRSKNILQELGELSQLTRLGVTELKTDDAKELCHSLEKMTNLRSLDVTAESESEVIDLDILSSPPLLLRGLYMAGCLKELPHWVPLLNKLAGLRLGWSRLKSSPLIALQNLPNLVDLYLQNAFDGETLVFGDGGFPKLKKLHFEDLENLSFVLMNGQAMPCLESLSIVGCSRLDWQSLLVVIRGLANLKDLKFFGMPEEFALAFYPQSSSGMREGVVQECYEEVMERNPRVSFIWQIEGHWEMHDLSIQSYNVIKGRAMSRDEVLPQVS